jgi:hypothetical protein
MLHHFSYIIFKNVMHTLEIGQFNVFIPEHCHNITLVILTPSYK